MTQYIPSTSKFVSNTVNVDVIWKRKHFIVRSGIYFSMVAFLVLLILSWKTNYEAILRIEPELSTTGEVTSIDSEMDVIQSWATVSQAIKQMHRAVIVKPLNSSLFLHIRYYIYYIYHLFSTEPAKDFASYQPSIKLGYFDISGNEDDYVGQKFELQVEKGAKYTLYSPDGSPLIKAKVGDIGEGLLSDGKRKIQLLVSKINADEGANFLLIPAPFEAYTKDIQDALIIDRKGFREASGLMTVQYKNKDPVVAQQVLDALVNTYISQAYDRSSLGKIHGLDKLREKSKILKTQLEEAQNSLADFKVRNHVVDMAQDEDTASQLLLTIRADLSKVTAQQRQGTATLTENHPSMIALHNQINYLQAEEAKVIKLIDSFPDKQKEDSMLEDNVEIYKTMLDQNTADVAKLDSEVETITGYAHLISLHQLEKIPPVLRAILAIIFGFLSAAAMALFWLVRNTSPAFARIRYDEDLSAVSSLPVVARFPFKWSGMQWLWYRMQARSGGTVITDREWNAKALIAIENLDKAVPFLLPNGTHQILLFTSVDDQEGSRFSARKLAEIGATHLKTLIVDAQILHPNMHEEFEVSSTPGLTDVLAGQASLQDAIRPSQISNLFILPAGTQTYNYRLVSDMPKISALLQSLSSTFDRIVIEFPPITPAICQEGILHCAHAVFIIVRRDTLTRKLETVLHDCGINILKSAFLILNKK